MFYTLMECPSCLVFKQFTRRVRKTFAETIVQRDETIRCRNFSLVHMCTYCILLSVGQQQSQNQARVFSEWDAAQQHFHGASLTHLHGYTHHRAWNLFVMAEELFEIHMPII